MTMMIHMRKQKPWMCPLSIDSDPLEINQYEATDFESEEPEKVGFIDSSSPELNETISLLQKISLQMK